MLSTDPSGGFPAALKKRRPSVDELVTTLDADPKSLPVVAAGALLKAADGRILFLKRSGDEKNYANHWAFPGGGLEEDESPEQACAREVREETGHTLASRLEQVADVATGSGRGRYVTFAADVGEPFAPQFRDGEHVAYVWARPEDAPQPLHPGVAELLGVEAGLRHATDSALRLALDESSVRHKVEDGNGRLWRLEIAKANISKATVNPYLGKEIPNAEALGLDPNKVYMLLRHPDELRKGAASSNMMQILRKHTPISADDHQPWDVVGTTGSAAEFEDPYLTNGLSIWSREAIKDIESDAKKELSCGYSYRAEMTPGNFGGTRYDGVMRDIKFNHVALVKDGRAGPDVVIGDSNEEIAMSNRELARQLAAVSSRQISVGALMAYLHPRMAMDARPSLATVVPMAKVFEGVTGSKFKESKPVIAKRLRELAGPKLAKDASLDDVEKVLDMLDGHEIEGGDASVSEAQHNAMGAAAGGNSELGIPKKVGEEFVEKDKGKSFDAAAFGEFLKGKGMDEAGVAEALGMLPKSEPKGQDEFPPKKEDEDDEEAKKKAAAAKAEDKKAMDAQIKLAVDEASKTIRAALLKTQQEVRQAEAEVRPWVGELPATMSFDSAEAVRRQALKMLGVAGHDTMHADALSTVLSVQPRPGSQGNGERHNPTPHLGMDESRKKTINDRFPGFDRVGAA
jgi:8-oxo-dGTP pyrophosphatase MutT (NUDIX family)